MSAYSEGYADGRRGSDHGDQYFGDDWAEYEAGLEQAERDLAEDDDAYDQWAELHYDAEEVGL